MIQTHITLYCILAQQLTRRACVCVYTLYTHTVVHVIASVVQIHLIVLAAAQVVLYWLTATLDQQVQSILLIVVQLTSPVVCSMVVVIISVILLKNLMMKLLHYADIAW
jgi:hypothetical protein